MKPHLVDNASEGWRWISTWSYAALLAWVAMPAEQQTVILSLLPLTSEQVVGVLALTGLIGRFIKQS